jgi:predicted acyltransferase
MDGSLASYIDRALLYNHLEIAHRFDPEGLLSSIPAIATCLFGVFAGESIFSRAGAQMIRPLLASALAYGFSAAPNRGHCALSPHKSFEGRLDNCF